MTQQTINVGTTANDKQGDSLRAAFEKVNENFTELYAATYTPAVSGDWSGTAPTTVAAALDRIAAALGPIA